MDKPDYDYTPGDWAIGKDRFSEILITSSDYRSECDANHVVAHILRGPRKMMVANARLIAAAPELLSVCKNIASDLEAMLGSGDMDGTNEVAQRGVMQVMLASLQQAIAKAEWGGVTDDTTSQG